MNQELKVLYNLYKRGVGVGVNQELKVLHNLKKKKTTTKKKTEGWATIHDGSHNCLYLTTELPAII